MPSSHTSVWRSAAQRPSGGAAGPIATSGRRPRRSIPWRAQLATMMEKAARRFLMTAAPTSTPVVHSSSTLPTPAGLGGHDVGEHSVERVARAPRGSRLWVASWASCSILAPAVRSFALIPGVREGWPMPKQAGESPKAYTDMAGRAGMWQWMARDLLAAANAIHVHRRGPAVRRGKGTDDARVDTSAAPILMLYGMALENLLKGLLIAQGTPATVSGELNPVLKTHHVLELWRKAGLAIDTEQERLLSALGWAVETGGRYPVGRRPNPSAMPHLLVAMEPVKSFIGLFAIAEDAFRRWVPDAPFGATDLLNWGV